jgi:hypothetical protein
MDGPQSTKTRQGKARMDDVTVVADVPLASSVNGDLDCGGGSKKRHTFPRLSTTKGDKTCHPFIDEPDEKELVMYRCLLVAKPFATPKGKGITEAWNAAVKEINCQVDFASGRLVFDPPIPVKTVRERFEGVMKIVKKLQEEVPFRSGEDDEAEPNEMMVLLEDMYEMKTSFEGGQSTAKESAIAKKKKDREAAKAIQQAAIGDWSACKTPKPKLKAKASPKDDEGDVDEGSKKKPKRSPVDAIVALAESYAQKQEDMKADRELKRRRIESEMAVQAKMLEMMEAISKKLSDNK